MLPSVPSTRKYTYGVILVGVIGIGLVALFVWVAGRRLDALGYRDLGAYADPKARLLQTLLVQAFGRAREEEDAAVWTQLRLGPRHPDAWSRAARHLGLPQLGFSDLVGLVARDPDGQVVWSHGPGHLLDRPPVDPGRDGRAIQRQGGPWLALGVRFPEGAAAGDAVDVTAYLDVGLNLGDREALTQFLTFGLVGLAIVIYVLAAVTILINRAQTRLIHRELEKGVRLRAIADVAGGIAHEVRNPLNAISLSVQYMQKVAERGDRLPTPKEYARIHLELGKIRKVVDSFVKFARTGDMALRPMDLGETMAEAVARYQPDMTSGGVTCRFTREGDLASVGDREKLLEVFAAVIQNALDSMTGRLGGDLRIRVDGRRGGVRITVRDSGEVTDEGSLGNIFEPAFSHRDTAMGLGMTVARTFVESHGGTIAAGLAQGGGCVVTIDLPRRRSV